jgi:hypothetical protein
METKEILARTITKPPILTVMKFGILIIVYNCTSEAGTTGEVKISENPSMEVVSGGFCYTNNKFLQN